MIKQPSIAAGILMPNFGIIFACNCGVLFFVFVSKTLAFEEKGGSPVLPTSHFTLGLRGYPGLKSVITICSLVR